MKITMTFGILLLLAALQAQAQNSACPVQPTLVKNINSQLALAFQNTSGKAIASYQFALTFVDSNGHTHAFPHVLSEKVQMRASAHRTAIWPSKLAQLFLFPYAQVFLQQVTFTDGTLWVDDGAHSCSVMSVQE
jgi:hypothetical protein